MIWAGVPPNVLKAKKYFIFKLSGKMSKIRRKRE